MIFIFDLDDTLYSERRYIESGFLAVARWLENSFGWPSNETFQDMILALEKDGRGRIFNKILEQRGVMTKRIVNTCIKMYRHHAPDISLEESTKNILSSIPKPLYLVTDGHKVVQQNKIISLGIEKYFKKVFITYRYGINKAKPSTYCFELIRRLEKCDWGDMLYIGDNPEKDFVNLNPLGVRTIRVLTGGYSCVQAKQGFDALHSVESFCKLPELLQESGYV